MSNWQQKVGELGSKVSEAVEQQKQRIAQSQEASALQKQLQALFNQKAGFYLELGRQVHSHARRGERLPEGITVPAGELRELDVHIFTLQKKLEALQESSMDRLCTSCQEPIGADDKFCGGCGARQSEPNPEPETVCAACSQDIPASAAFCHVCGAKVGQHAL
ncbi:zinc ribbon domain-containing protein [Ectobacillus ponti]|uniref:Zinc ribbon domain-containing protein n=1 Tax=Ectobacillus ponti TaxID=2961894 RepID=A0AA41X8U8_9BACI|nr:zinc ribbon domain-containing protein [Ectobacillus ponti]MCP8971039.1 zinc ribbon domain-containing protein [Ectobacillus ponti]